MPFEGVNRCLAIARQLFWNENYKLGSLGPTTSERCPKVLKTTLPKHIKGKRRDARFVLHLEDSFCANYLNHNFFIKEPVQLERSVRVLSFKRLLAYLQLTRDFRKRCFPSRGGVSSFSVSVSHFLKPESWITPSSHLLASYRYLSHRECACNTHPGLLQPPTSRKRRKGTILFEIITK